MKELNIKVEDDSLYDVSNINNPVERAIQEYKKHPSIKMINEIFGNNKKFSFDLVSFGTIFKEIVSLDTNKGMHRIDVPTKIVKANADLFSICVSNAFNESMISWKFLSVLKLADVAPVHEKSRPETTNQLVYYLTFQKCLKDACIDKSQNKYQNILKL